MSIPSEEVRPCSRPGSTLRNMAHHSTPVETQNSSFSGSAIVTQRVGPKLRRPSWSRRAPSASSRFTSTSPASLFEPFPTSLWHYPVHQTFSHRQMPEAPARERNCQPRAPVDSSIRSRSFPPVCPPVREIGSPVGPTNGSWISPRRPLPRRSQRTNRSGLRGSLRCSRLGRRGADEVDRPLCRTVDPCHD